MGDFGHKVERLLAELQDSLVKHYEQELEALRSEIQDLKHQLDEYAKKELPAVAEGESQRMQTPKVNTSILTTFDLLFQAQSEAVGSAVDAEELGIIVENEGDHDDLVVRPCADSVRSTSEVDMAASEVRHADSDFRRARRSNRFVDPYVMKPGWREKCQVLRGTSVLSTHTSTSIDAGLALVDDGRGHAFFILDPDSWIALLRGWVSILFLMYDVFYIPVDLAFDAPEATWTETVRLGASMFWTLDMVLSCITGAYINSLKEMRFKRIMRHYALTWLPLDLGIVCMDWIMYFASTDIAKRSPALLRILRLMRLGRLARLGQIRNVVSHVGAKLCPEAPELTSGVGDALMIVLNLTVMVHILSCTWYGLANSADVGFGVASPSPEYLLRNYLTSVLWTLTLLSASNEDHIQSTKERGLAFATACTTLLLCAYIFAKATCAVLAVKESKKSRLIAISRQFVRTRKISRSLTARVHQYLQVQLDMGMGDLLASERVLVASLPESLQADINAEVRTPVLTSSQFFYDVQAYQPRALRRICQVAMSEVLTLGQDAAFAAGDACEHMTFVTNGLFTYLPGQREQLDCRNPSKLWSVMSTSDASRSDGSCNLIMSGRHLSEPVLWTRWEHKGDLVAIKDSLSLRLSADKFEESIRHNVAVSVHAMNYAKHFVWHMNHGKELVDSDLVEFDLPMEHLHDTLFAGTDSQHFFFISHFKKESGTEATLLAGELQRMIRADPTNAASEFKIPVFLDSENLRDMSDIASDVERSRYMLLLLTPGVLSRPWCLLEVVHAVRHGVVVLPIEIRKPDLHFEFPTEEFYSKLLAGNALKPEAVDMLRNEGILRTEVVSSLRTVFRKISLSFSPHESAAIRQAQLDRIMSSCLPIAWDDNE